MRALRILDSIDPTKFHAHTYVEYSTQDEFHHLIGLSTKSSY